MAIETCFDVPFVTQIASREKQIQQSYRPNIGIHKWFARRPGTVFRSLLLSEFDPNCSLSESYWRSHSLSGLIADPFMGGGTTLAEATRTGFSTIGVDINPIAYWIVKETLSPLDHAKFLDEVESVLQNVERLIRDYYVTRTTDQKREVPVKYFIWVKVMACPICGYENDLLPGHLLAKDSRHPRNVIVCPTCGELNETENIPSIEAPVNCWHCGGAVYIEGPARKNQITCSQCGQKYRYPPKQISEPLHHRLWAIEYYDPDHVPRQRGRFFKKPDSGDLSRYAAASENLNRLAADLPIPREAIPNGDETQRLHRWGYQYYRQMFNPRQLLGLGLLLQHITNVKNDRTKHALLTVFSDFLRYQNMLCRYDTYALKCQDIFSVHGFPVGLVQCENSLLGVPNVGSGSFRHFIEKYLKAKRYCISPFETDVRSRRKYKIPTVAERIQATVVNYIPTASPQESFLSCGSADRFELPEGSLDGVFTDPPYYNNVQYAELMDFCYVWLKDTLSATFSQFRADSTRAVAELTGNATMKRSIFDFAAGLSAAFRNFARGLKPNAPFVFTYHHNDTNAYIPVVIAILDSQLKCTKVLPVPAEMGASIHIHGTNSSVVDSVFVSRRLATYTANHPPVSESLMHDCQLLSEGGLKVTKGDMACLYAGHIAHRAVTELYTTWDPSIDIAAKFTKVQAMIDVLTERNPVGFIESLSEIKKKRTHATQII